MINIETATFVITVIGAVLVWTTSVIGGVLWLNMKFGKIEKLVFREIHKVDVENQSQNMRIQRLELRTFGFIEVGGEKP